MSIRSVLARTAWAVLIAAASAGCTAHSRPPIPIGWLSPPGPGGPGGDGFGAWVIVESGFMRGDVLGGELIAIRADSLWVLTESGLRSQALRKVGLVRLFTDAIASDRVHGEQLVRDLEADLRPWARFPQGLPRGLDPITLRPKPLATP